MLAFCSGCKYPSECYHRKKKCVESLYDFQMICHLHSVTECLQTVT